MRKHIFFYFCLLLAISGFSQAVTSPSASLYTQNTSNQDASGFSISGFNPTTTLLITVGLVNPPSGTTLRFNTTTGISASDRSKTIQALINPAIKPGTKSVR